MATTTLKHDSTTLEPSVTAKRGKASFPGATPPPRSRNVARSPKPPAEQLSDWDHAS